jgi:uncharacterized protein
MKISRWMALLVSLALFAWAGGSAMAQGEPTLDQIYQAANTGRMNDARSMIDQVLKNHPRSAKAHYVKAEIAARQHEGAVAQEELASAERIEPGLPFAKPQSVAALRTQIQDLSSARAQPRSNTMGMNGAPAAASAPASPGLPWGKIIIGLAVALGIMALLRRRVPSPTTYGAPAQYNNGTPASGPGYGPGYGGPGMQPGMGGGYAPYGQPPQPGMGSTLGRGLATGLAMGAGAVAAEEIGRRMLDHRGNPIPPDANAGNFGLSDPSAMDNVDMGGNDFGVNDAGSWDDGGGGGMDAGDIGGGGDWDNS